MVVVVVVVLVVVVVVVIVHYNFPGVTEREELGGYSPLPCPTFFLRWCFLLNFFPLASHFRDPYQNVAQPPFQTYSVAPVSIVSQIKFLVS